MTLALFSAKTDQIRSLGVGRRKVPCPAWDAGVGQDRLGRGGN